MNISADNYQVICVQIAATVIHRYLSTSIFSCRIRVPLWWTPWKIRHMYLKYTLKSEGWFYVMSWRFIFGRPSSSLQALFHYNVNQISMLRVACPTKQIYFTILSFHNEGKSLFWKLDPERQNLFVKLLDKWLNEYTVARKTH